MKRFLVLSVMAGSLLISTGCIVIAKGRMDPQQRQVVVVDGEVYIVDLSGEGATKIDPASLANADIVDQEIDDND